MTVRLVAIANAHWASFDGWSGDSDPLDLPMDRFLNRLYYWATREADEQSISKFNLRLWRPPKGAEPAPGSPWSPEAETAAFKTFAAAFKSGTAVTKQGEKVT